MSATSKMERVRRWIDQWLDDLQEKIEELEEIENPRPAFGDPRPLEDADIEGWLEDAYNPLKDAMEKAHPYRWRRLRRDLKWIRKEMILMGLNPNDLRRWVG